MFSLEPNYDCVIFLCLVCIGSILAAPDSHIIGGSDADIADYPYQCSLRYSGSHTCGCVILSASKILTAAHCVDGRTISSFSVIVGQTDRTVGQQIPITSAVMHPNYNNGDYTFYNDVATATLSASVDLNNPNIQVADLAKPADGDFAGVECTLTGWGRTSSSNTLPETLQQTQMPALVSSSCENSMNAIGGKIGPGHICFSSSDTGACNGDSGGPARCNNKVSGIASWVVSSGGNCMVSYPSVYARVSEYYDWITA
ncbi:fibrinolytic enzyme, isozyme C-like [Gigantopelta aegis]|uniref:fibrinolytic enzyme, isozyme C-like n=1 Tax=Gigantopelta aegis TaxID=1735272 RepID=UPI001B88DA3F|nr:fibrinolytic enzyme, isozyme C-like [Gigantopelta aegis]